MEETAPSAGDPVEARCTRCRKTTVHNILATAGSSPARLRCTACGREHKCRPDAAAAKPASRRPISRRDAELKAWDDLRLSLDSARATDYSMTAAYKVKSLIRHPVFGLGIVQRVVGPQKVAVLFEDGCKTMRCK